MKWTSSSSMAVEVSDVVSTPADSVLLPQDFAYTQSHSCSLSLILQSPPLKLVNLSQLYATPLSFRLEDKIACTLAGGALQIQTGS